MKYLFLILFTVSLNAQILPSQQATHYKKNSVAASSSQNFSYTGGEQSFTVPSGVTSILIKVWGAQGDNDQAGFNGQGAGEGKGGYAEGYLSVTAGQVLKVYVGEMPNCIGLCFNGFAGGFTTLSSLAFILHGSSPIRGAGYALASILTSLLILNLLKDKAKS